MTYVKPEVAVANALHAVKSQSAEKCSNQADASQPGLNNATSSAYEADE